MVSTGVPSTGERVGVMVSLVIAVVLVGVSFWMIFGRRIAL